MLTCDYIVEMIDGDYAHLRRVDEENGELKLVARALLPAEIMEGSKLHYEMLEYTRRLCLDNSISLDTEAYCSEACTGNRNRAIGYLLASKDMLHGDVLSCVDMYFQLCSLSVTARSLAGMSLVLSADGVDPKMGERLLDKRVVRTMKTLMFTCDMYDESGEYACRVGIPSKVVWVRRYYGLCRRMYGHWMLWPRP